MNYKKINIIYNINKKYFDEKLYLDINSNIINNRTLEKLIIQELLK